jgi:hypothetical protein
MSVATVSVVGVFVDDDDAAGGFWLLIDLKEDSFEFVVNWPADCSDEGVFDIGRVLLEDEGCDCMGDDVASRGAPVGGGMLID